MLQSLMSWLNPWQVRPYVVAVGPIGERNIKRRFWFRDNAVAYCEDRIDLHGDDANVWYQYALDGFIKMPIWEDDTLASAEEEHAN